MFVRSAARRLLLKMAIAAIAIPSAAGATSSNPPIRIVIGFAAGGALDALARPLAEKLRTSLNTTVMVENRPGAASKLALQHVARSPADGTTVLISSASPFTIYPLTHKRLPYDPDNDFVPVAYIADVPVVASTSVDQPYRTMQEYLAWAKGNPQKGAVGLSALGGIAHFGVTSLSKAIDVPLIPVSYRGAAPMLTDLIGGRLPLGIDAVGGQMELYRAGRLRFLAVNGTQRSRLFPEVPTFKETGAPGFESSSWYGAFVRAGTAPAIVARIEKALLDAAEDPAIAQTMARLGMEMKGKPGLEFGKIIQEQREHWRPIVKATGFTADD